MGSKRQSINCFSSLLQEMRMEDDEVKQLMLAKQKVQDQVVEENKVIHSTIHRDRKVARQALLRRKNLQTCLGALQQRLDSLDKKKYSADLLDQSVNLFRISIGMGVFLVLVSTVLLVVLNNQDVENVNK